MTALRVGDTRLRVIDFGNVTGGKKFFVVKICRAHGADCKLRAAVARELRQTCCDVNPLQGALRKDFTCITGRLRYRQPEPIYFGFAFS